MKIDIDFQSTNRFFMSTGLALIIVAIVLIFGFQPGGLFLLITIIILLFGLYLFIYGFKELKNFEDLEKKIKFEFMVNQIIEQDLKLIEIMIKNLEYNEKIRLIKDKDISLPGGFEKLEEKQFRSIKGIVRQALNPNFYDETYPKISGEIGKHRHP